MTQESGHVWRKGDSPAAPVCTVHIGVSGDKGIGGTLKTGTPAHLLVSEGVSAGKSDLVKHLLHQLTFRPHQSGLRAMALQLPLPQKMAAIGVAQAAGISSKQRAPEKRIVELRPSQKADPNFGPPRVTASVLLAHVNRCDRPTWYDTTEDANAIQT